MGLGRARRDVQAALDVRTQQQTIFDVASTAATTRELEQIARGVAAADPFFKTASGDVLCAFCKGRPDTHSEQCVWIASKLWARRNLP
jgi:hypothetical protein